MSFFFIPGVKDISPQQLPWYCWVFSAGSRVIAYALFTIEKIAMILKRVMPPQKILIN